MVTNPNKATHICLDTDNDDNDWLRDAGPGQFVVSLDWVEDSFLEQASADENQYRLDGDHGGGTARPSSSHAMDVDEDTRHAEHSADDEFVQLAQDTSGSDEEFEQSSGGEERDDHHIEQEQTRA